MSGPDDPTDFDGKPTLRYEVEGDEYLARPTGASSYVSQYADGSGVEFHMSSLPDDATIVETANGGDPLNPDRDADPGPGVDECDHDAAQLDHHDQHGPEVEFWVACADCGGFWTLTGDLDRETAYISRDEAGEGA